MRLFCIAGAADLGSAKWPPLAGDDARAHACSFTVLEPCHASERSAEKSRGQSDMRRINATVDGHLRPNASVRVLLQHSRPQLQVNCMESLGRSASPYDTGRNAPP